MQKISQFLAKYIWAVILIMLIGFGIGVFYVAGLYKERQTDKAIQQTRNQANSAVSESVNSMKQADNSAVERQTEDAIRERIITPKLGDARRKSNTSKIELEKLNNEKANLHNSHASRADNCSELHRLFPNEKFEYCHD